MQGIVTGVILLLIVAYFVFVFRLQVKKAKEGNFCGSCSGCSKEKECSLPSEIEG